MKRQLATALAVFIAGPFGALGGLVLGWFAQPDQRPIYSAEHNQRESTSQPAPLIRTGGDFFAHANDF